MAKNTLSIVVATLLFTTHTHANTKLEDISITTSSKLPTSIEKTTANVTVISSEEIEEKGYLTVAEAISSVAGISVSHSGGLGQPTSFFVRGSDSGKVLILLDGMRLNDPSTTDGRALLDALTTSNIAQIEIVKGGSSSIWGSNASAGVINIITKDAKDGVHGSVGFSYGSYNTKGADAALSYKDEKLMAQVLVSYLDTDGFSAIKPRDAEEDGYTNKNFNLKLGYTFNDNNKLNISYNLIDTETEYDDTFSMAQSDDNYSHATSDQSNIALEYLFTVANYSAAFHASQGEYDRDYYTTGFFGDGHNVYKAILKEYALINGYDYTSGKAVLGLEYKEIDGFNQYNTFPESQADYINKAIYISNIYDINQNTLLETNLRHDTYDEFDNKTTYKIGIKHMPHLLQDLTTSVNYYTSYDAPSSYQLANTTFGSLLTPSYSEGFDISAGYKKLLQVTYFNNKVEDYIDYTSDPITYIGGYSNVDGTSKFSGLEIESEYIFTRYNLILSANYTHLFNFEKEDGSDLPRRAKDTLNASLNYYTTNDMHFGIDALYIGDRVDTDGGYPVASDVQTGNYTVWNLNLSTKVMHHFDLGIHAKNIFDKEYQSVYNYATAGRSAYAKVSYSF